MRLTGDFKIDNNKQGIMSKKGKGSFFNNFLGGDVFSKETVVRQLPFILYVVLLLMLYISNTYLAEDMRLEIKNKNRLLENKRVEREELLEQARKVDIKIDTVQGARGNIYSVNGTMLASTVSLYDIGFDFMGVKIDTLERHIGPLTDSLSKLLHRPKAEFEKLLRYGYKYGNEHKYRCVYLAKGLKIDEYQRLKTFPLFRKKSGNGLNITKRMVREHPYGILAMRTVGLVEKSDLQNRSKSSLMKGVVGLEGQYDSCLRGEIGYQLMRRVSGGNRIQVPSSINKEPKNGCDIYTSIDVELQDVAEEALMRCLKENEAEKGCVIMMDVETGFVEVMANLEYNYNTKQYEER